MNTSAKAVQACVLLADISGSTPLYEAVGDQEAQRVVSNELARLHAVMIDHGGVCIRQKGDDVLGYFAAPDPAFRAVCAMVARPPADHALRIHAGLHYGQIVLADGDIFGEAVNLTARLASLANAGEALLSRSLFDQLAPVQRAGLQPLDRLRLKGISAPIEVYAFVDGDPMLQTNVFARPAQGELGVAEVDIVLTHGRRTHRCGETQRLVIGRSNDCGIVLSQPWVSRRHAVVTVAGGKVLLEDRSASGTYVAIEGSHELFLRRETIMLASHGVISPAIRPGQAEAEPIHFRISQR